MDGNGEMRKGGTIDIEAYLRESALVQKILLEPRKHVRLRCQCRSTGGAGRRACVEEARQDHLGGRHFGLGRSAKHRP